MSRFIFPGLAAAALLATLSLSGPANATDHKTNAVTVDHSQITQFSSQRRWRGGRGVAVRRIYAPRRFYGSRRFVVRRGVYAPRRFVVRRGFYRPYRAWGGYYRPYRAWGFYRPWGWRRAGWGWRRPAVVFRF